MQIAKPKTNSYFQQLSRNFLVFVINIPIMLINSYMRILPDEISAELLNSIRFSDFCMSGIRALDMHACLFTIRAPLVAKM